MESRKYDGFWPIINESNGMLEDDTLPSENDLLARAREILSMVQALSREEERLA